MSDEDSEPAGDDDVEPGTIESFQERLKTVDQALEDATTEEDLDAVETKLTAIKRSMKRWLSEDERSEARASLESRVENYEQRLADQRGPYVSEAADDVEGAAETLADTRWTDDGAAEVLAAVEAFGEAVDDHVDVPAVETVGAAIDALETAASTLADTGLDPDTDTEAIESIQAAADQLTGDIEAAEAFDDLSIREKLEYDGFFSVLEGEHRKDFPPELNALLLWQKRYKESRDPEDVEPILQALELLDSEFMEENILDTLERIAPPEAFEPVLQRAERRDKHAIRVLGKLADERAVETLIEFVEGDGDPAVQRVTLRALGEIGSQEATQAIADRLVADADSVRSAAARALGLLGDPRAIDPLADVLDEDDADEVRASAAWALTQIGTRRALDIASEYVDDRSYVVQAEAEKATSA